VLRHGGRRFFHDIPNHQLNPGLKYQCSKRVTSLVTLVGLRKKTHRLTVLKDRLSDCIGNVVYFCFLKQIVCHLNTKHNRPIKCRQYALCFQTLRNCWRIEDNRIISI